VNLEKDHLRGKVARPNRVEPAKAVSQTGDRIAQKRILIFEADKALARLLACESDFALCEAVNSSSDRVRQTIVWHRPDLVLVNLAHCEKEALRFIRDVRSLNRPIKVLAVSMRASQANQALRAGADGYIHASEDSKELAFAIRDALSGHLYISETALCDKKISKRSHRL